MKNSNDFLCNFIVLFFNIYNLYMNAGCGYNYVRNTTEFSFVHK